MRFLKFLLLGMASVALMAGCESNESSAGVTTGGQVNNSSTSHPSLLKSKSQDVSDSVVEVEEVLVDDDDDHGKKSCHDKKKNKKQKKEKQVKVAICHRPPGNPENAHTLILPLKAVLKHLVHGGPHHGDHDYMGPCDGDNEDDMEDLDPEDPTYGNDDEGGSGDDGGGGDYGSDDGADSDDGSDDDAGGDDGSSDGSDDSTQNPVPQYCTDNMTDDPDCDGVNDQSGDLMY